MLRTYLAAKLAARGKSIYSSPTASRSSAFRSSYRSYLEPLEARHLLSATVIQVTTTQDIVDPNDDFTSLREAILAANASPEDNEIVLPAGTYTLTRQGANEDAGLTGDLDITNNGSLKITGALSDTTIDASGLYNADLGYGDRIFDVLAGASVSIEGIILQGGNSSADGGAVRITSAAVSLSDASFYDNIAAGSGGSIYSGPESSLSGDARFGGGAAGADGGAIYSAGSLSIAGSRFSGNSATRGGAIFHTGSQTASFDATTFLANTGGQKGGAIAAFAPLHITGSTLVNNGATYGGGIYAADSTVSMIGTTINGNAAGWGGAMWSDSASISIENSLVAGNYAQIDGGAIRTAGDLRVVHVTFTGNISDGGDGGAIAWLPTYQVGLQIQDSEFSYNRGRNGGGLYANGGRVQGVIQVQNTVFSNNQAGSQGNGGGIFAEVPDSPLEILSCEFTHNVAGSGGGISSRLLLFLRDSILQGNEATGLGGGVIVESNGYGPSSIISNTEFRNNRATNGGAIRALGGLQVTGCILAENVASENGGALYFSGAGTDPVIDRSAIYGNSAGYRGGAFYGERNSWSTYQISNSTLAQNTAGVDGGAIYTLGNIGLSNSTVVLNRADQDGDGSGSGGGIALSATSQAGATGKAALSNSIVAGNSVGSAESDVPSDIALFGGTVDAASGYNLIGDPNSAAGLVNGAGGNIVGDGLGGVLDLSTVLDTTLAENGGPTATYALLANGPAVNAGDPNYDVSANPFDQRGAGFTRVTGGRVDIGAFEFGSEFQNVVAGRQVFYNNSWFDNPYYAGGDIDSFNSFAIDPTKQALLPNGTLAGPANVTSYSRGINGIMVDVAGSHPDITADDFLFRVGATNDPASWAVAPAPAAIQVLPGQGVGGSDRVVITWPDGAIKNTYLQVILAADEHTGLAEPDEFFFGNRVGDTFAATPPGAFVTNISDELATRFASQTGLDVSNALDFDKNGQININDGLIARGNPGFLPRIKIGPSSVDAVAVASQQAADASSVSSGNETQLESGGNAIAFALAQADLSRAALATPAATLLVESKLRAEPKDIPQAQIVDRVLSSGQSPVGGMATASELAVPADLLSDLDEILDSLLN